MNAYYRFPKITPQGERSQYYYINAGLKQQLFNNKASVTVTATDVFHTYKVTRSFQSNDLNQIATFQRKLPVVYIGFTWRFNNYKEKNDLEYEADSLKK